MLKLIDSGLAKLSWGLAILVWVLLFAGPSLIGADKKEPTVAGATVDGKAVFADAGCGGCHTLGAAGSSGTTGPALDGAALAPDAISTVVKDGRGVMPAFGGKLSDAEITALADFVARASAGAAAATPTATATATATETATETATPEPEPTETATPEPTQDASAAGQQVFASAGCGGCHTLAAAGASGQSAPSLDALGPSVAQVIEAVTNGRGQMPAFGGQLTKEQIRSLAEFVADAAGR